MMASDPLASCPFCGATGKDEIGAYLLSGVWRVCCLNCNTTIGAFTTKTEAIAAWNRRVPAAPAVPPDIAETMRETLMAQRAHNDEWGYQWGSDIQNQIYARLDKALAWLAAQKGEE